MLGEALAVASALLWAAASVLYAKGLRGAEPFRANVVRALPPFALLLPVALAKGSLLEVLYATPEALVATFASAIFAFFLGDTLFMIAIKRGGTAVGVATSYTYPLFVAAIAATLLGERLGVPDIVGAAAIVAGIALISLGRRGSEDPPLALGRVLPGVACAISWSASISVLKVALKSLSPLTLLVVRLALLCVLFPWAVRELRVDARALAYLSVGGVLALGFGALAFLTSLELVGAGVATPLSALAPMFSAVGEAMAGGKVTRKVAAGVTLCTLGSAAISLP